MAEARTFSESWYRVANQHISLRPHAQCQRQLYRGQEWVVVRDPFTNRFYRLRPAAYHFIARLRPSRTVQEVWDEVVERTPDEAPGQEEVIQLLAQLYHANLLYYDSPADSAKLFERYRQARQRETTAKALNIMFAHFPLLDPDTFLKRTLPVARLLFSPLGFVVWCAVLVVGLKLGLENFAALRQQSEGILSPRNLPLLYVSLILLKTSHEFGHAYACRRYGGEVHTMGVMLLIFTPLPYMDATSSWSFRSRWRRVLVGSAGMLVELFVAACATVVWARTSPGLVHSLAYNMIFIASVSTLLFNGNPLLRFDGYYILSDLLDIPNLHQQCSRQLTHIIERYAFGCRRSHGAAATRSEAAWLLFYGVLSRVYRIFVFVRILLFVADRFLLAGIIMFVLCVFSWVLTPLGKLLNYLVTSPKLDRTRVRAAVVCAACCAAVFSVFYWIPYPDRFRAPGVIEAGELRDVINEAPGRVSEILLASRTTVTRGTPLVRLTNHELPHQIATMRARRAETEARLLQALDEEPADLEPLRNRLRVIEENLAKLLADESNLVVTAPSDGLWLCPNVEELRGRWLARGTTMGNVLSPDDFTFAAVVTQAEASRLFGEEIEGAEIRLRGKAHLPLTIRATTVIPAEQTVLPSAALGWLGGGDVAVDLDDRTGRRTVEPFFEVRTQVDPVPGLALLHGRSGRIRFELAPRPLLLQWYRRVRQLLQKRYRI